MLNGWLLYQTLACRIWAALAFYQSSGAYGFRDQLQGWHRTRRLASCDDARTSAARAARQFVEGDVQHWWLPYSGQGVRTRISDDRAWLATPSRTTLKVVSDAAVLDEWAVPGSQTLAAHEHDSFFLPTVSDEVATLFEPLRAGARPESCLGWSWSAADRNRRLERGMNRVGEAGRAKAFGWVDLPVYDVECICCFGQCPRRTWPRHWVASARRCVAVVPRA